LHERARDEGLAEGTPSYAKSLMNQGTVQRDLGMMGENPEQNFEEAKELYTEARQIFDGNIDHDSLKAIDENLARLYLSRGKKSKAYESYKNAIESIEEIRSTVKFRDHREEFFEEHVSTYYETVSLALELGEDEEAFEYAERAKGRIFLEMLDDTRIKGDVPDELAEREQKLKEEIAQLRTLVRTDGPDRGIASSSFSVLAGTSPIRADVGPSSRSASTPPGEELDPPRQTEEQTLQTSLASLMTEELFERLESKKEQHREVLEDIRKEDPEAYTLRTVNVAPLNQVQDALSPNEQILEYVLTDDEILIFLIDDKELDYQRVSMDDAGESNSLPEVVAEYRELVGPPGPGQGEVSRMQELGQVLYRMLIEPVEERLNDENLLIVPHGSLHLLPFPALYDGKNYLVEEYRIRFLANASSLRFLNNKGESHNNGALVVGDPRGDLEYAREEAREVAELHDSEVLIGDDATKAAIQQRIETAKISHLCCHGYYDPESPTHSSLFFAEEEMYLEEVFNLDVGSELVTLSACQTAYGDVSRGDEVKSLTRGFQYAGSPSVIGTLWSVDDESTRRFFRRFYDSEGDIAERLRRTQVAFIREDDEWSHPFYWSAFQMYGTG